MKKILNAKINTGPFFKLAGSSFSIERANSARVELFWEYAVIIPV